MAFRMQYDPNQSLNHYKNSQGTQSSFLFIKNFPQICTEKDTDLRRFFETQIDRVWREVISCMDKILFTGHEGEV